MIKEKLAGVHPVRMLLLTLAIVSSAMPIQWDRHRLHTDFDNTMSLLRFVWIDAGVNDRQLIVRFDGKRVVVVNRNTGIGMSALKIPTLHEVNYDTTLGNKMIVYSGVGTSAYNKREHGGDLTLRSWFGFKKSIAVNCNGLVTEGRYPGD